MDEPSKPTEPPAEPRGCGGFRLFSGLLALALIGLLLLVGTVEGRRRLYEIAFRNDLATTAVLEHVIENDSRASGAIVALLDSKRELTEDQVSHLRRLKSISTSSLKAAIPTLSEIWALRPEHRSEQLPMIQWTLVEACLQARDAEVHELLVRLFRDRKNPDLRMRIIQALTASKLSKSTKEELRTLAAGVDHPWLHRDVIKELGTSEAFEQLAVPCWQETVRREGATARSRVAFGNLIDVLQIQILPRSRSSKPETTPITEYHFEDVFGELYRNSDAEVRCWILDSIESLGGPAESEKARLQLRELHLAILDSLEELSPISPALEAMAPPGYRDEGSQTLPQRLRSASLRAIAFLNPKVIVAPALTRLQTARPGVRADLIRALSYNVELFATRYQDRREHPLLGLTTKARAELLQPFLKEERFKAVRPHALVLLEHAVEAPEEVLPGLLRRIEMSMSQTPEPDRWPWLNRRPGNYPDRAMLRRLGDYLRFRPDSAELIKQKVTAALFRRTLQIGRSALRYRRVQPLHTTLTVMTLKPALARTVLAEDPHLLKHIQKRLTSTRELFERLKKKGGENNWKARAKTGLKWIPEIEALLSELGPAAADD